jgi:hypothetical protein
MKLKGFDSAEHAVATAARSGKPGANRTSAPTFSALSENSTTVAF